MNALYRTIAEQLGVPDASDADIEAVIQDRAQLEHVLDGAGHLSARLVYDTPDPPAVVQDFVCAIYEAKRKPDVKQCGRQCQSCRTLVAAGRLPAYS